MTLLITTCSGCMGSVKVDTEAGTATGRVKSNGVRGQNHKPAHNVTVDLEMGDVLGHYECPIGCGYLDSVYLDDATRRALA